MVAGSLFALCSALQLFTCGRAQWRSGIFEDIGNDVGIKEIHRDRRVCSQPGRLAYPAANGRLDGRIEDRGLRDRGLWGTRRHGWHAGGSGNRRRAGSSDGSRPAGRSRIQKDCTNRNHIACQEPDGSGEGVARGRTLTYASVCRNVYSGRSLTYELCFQT